MHGEADLLPSLIVDRYGDYLVVQALSQGMDRLLPVVITGCSPSGCIRGGSSRATIRGRALWTACRRRSRCWLATCPTRSPSREPASRYEVDLRHGQKTGAVPRSAGEPRGGGALRAGSRARLLQLQRWLRPEAGVGATETIAFDISEDAVARVRANAARNGLSVDARVGNVFDELRGLDRLKERFDTIVLDPPAFAKTKSAVEKAVTGYKEINLRALKLLNPGGILVTCSCSYNISEGTFAQIVYEAALDAQAHVTVVEKRMQGRDHPVLLGVPETYYLKCFILRKLG